LGGIPRKRTEDRQIGQELVKLDPEGMRAYLLEHPLSDGGRLWCDRVIQGVAAGERTSMRLFGDAMRWTGAQVNVFALFTERLGLQVRNEDELVAMVRRGEKMRELEADRPLREYFEAGLSLLRQCIAKDPGLQHEAAAALAAMSNAREATNGHAEEG